MENIQRNNECTQLAEKICSIQRTLQMQVDAINVVPSLNQISADFLQINYQAVDQMLSTWHSVDQELINDLDDIFRSLMSMSELQK